MRHLTVFALLLAATPVLASVGGGDITLNGGGHGGGYTSYGSGSYGTYHGYGSGTYTRSLYGTGYFGGSWVGGGERGVSFEHDPPPPVKWDEKPLEQIEVPEGIKKELKPNGTYYFGDKE